MTEFKDTSVNEITGKPTVGVVEGSSAYGSSAAMTLPVQPKVELHTAEAPLRPGQEVKTQRVFKRRPVEKDVTKQTKEEVEYILDEYSEMVTGTIINHEQPGNPIEFWFRGNGCPDITQFEFADNSYVKLQVGVAEHINKNCWIGKDRDGVNEDGKAIIEVGRKVRRYSFIPSGYFGSVDLRPVGEAMLPLYKQ